MFKHEALMELGNAVVVDSSKLSGIPAVKMAAFFAGLYAPGGTDGKRIVVVDNANTFFTGKNLLAELDKGTEDWPLIAEHFKIDLSETDTATIREYNRLISRIGEAVKLIKPDYKFAKVPGNWTVNHLQMEGQSIRRSRHNPAGDSYSYVIGLPTLRNIWGIVSPYWGGLITEPPTMKEMSFDGGSYSRKPVARPDRVDIGCQHIWRYELEQFAMSKGWALP